MQVLDTTIVNVALPYMQGELGTTSDQISWVLTSYLVSSAIIMPLTGYFSDIMGRRRFLLFSIAGFVVASALCGISRDLTQLVAFRLLQGVFGAALVPLSQAIMADAYPIHERGKAMALWGLGVMVGPVLGPTLGGWLTDMSSWRWTFYINVPVGALSLFLAYQFVPDTVRKSRSMDWTGFALLSMGIAGVQYFLDRGNQQDWFSARDIQTSAVLGVLGLMGFLAYAARKREQAVLDIFIFRDRNFAIACLLMLVTGVGLFGGLVVLPILLERLLDYPIVTAGLVMAPRGLATALAMLAVGRLVGRVDSRVLIAIGILVSAGGSYAMTFYSLDISPMWVIVPLFLQGIGLGFVFVPLSTLAYATLDRQRSAEAAGIYSLVRTIGGAIGISLVSTVLTRQTQVVWNELGGHINRYNPAIQPYFEHFGAHDPHTLAVLARQLATQAEMTAMLDVFQLITWSFILMLPLLLLLRRDRGA